MSILKKLDGKRYIQDTSLTAETGLTTWTPEGIKKGIFVNNQLVGPTHIFLYPPRTTYVTGPTISALNRHYGYITGNVHGFRNSTIRKSGSTEVYVSTKVRFVFKVLNESKPIVVWQQVKVEGGDGSKFCIVTYADPNIAGFFDPVQVIPAPEQE